MGNKNKVLTAVLILIALIIFLTIAKFAVNGNGSGNVLETPLLNKVTKKSTPTPSPSNSAPKTFQFDKSTDLKKELDSINPQVLESDFN